MKRILSLIVSVLMLAGMLAGCFGGTKEYTCQDVTMTVPSAMTDVSSNSEFKDFTFALDSKKVAIFGLKEDFSDFDGEDISLEDYADAVIEANGLDALAISRSGHDYMYFRYEAKSGDGTYKYLAGVYKGKDGFWLIQVASLVTQYDETAFFEYLDSVKLA